MSSPIAEKTKKIPPIERTWLQRQLHWVFEASLVIKGLLASGEALGGLGLLLTPYMAILHLVAWLTRHEIVQDPNDPMAAWFLHMVQAFPIQTKHFYAWYLMGHGFLKLLMVLMLARRILWAYPLAMAVLAGFVIYQLMHWTHSHSPVLLLLSGLDSLMIVLVFREWREMKRAIAKAALTGEIAT